VCGCDSWPCAGYGIDFAERYRWLPYIGVPKPEIVAQLVAARKAQEQKQLERIARQQAARIDSAATAAAPAPAAATQQPSVQPPQPATKEKQPAAPVPVVATKDAAGARGGDKAASQTPATPFVLNPSLVVSSVVNGRPKTAAVGAAATPHANGTRVALLPKPMAPGSN
jgi:hypothetical protein